MSKVMFEIVRSPMPSSRDARLQEAERRKSPPISIASWGGTLSRGESRAQQSRSGLKGVFLPATIRSLGIFIAPRSLLRAFFKEEKEDG